MNGWVEVAVVNPANSASLAELRKSAVPERYSQSNESILRAVGAASIQFEAPEILCFDNDSFELLQRNVARCLLDEINKVDPKAWVIGLHRQLKVNSDLNSLIHERQHLREAEERGKPIALTLTLIKSFNSRLGNWYFITGEAYTMDMSLEDAAMVALAPGALSVGDKSMAREYALESGNAGLQKYVERVISYKKSYEWEVWR